MNNQQRIDDVNLIIKKLQKNNYKLVKQKEDRTQLGAVSNLNFEDADKTKLFLMELINSGNDIRMMVSVYHYNNPVEIKYMDTDGGYTLSEILKEIENEVEPNIEENSV